MFSGISAFWEGFMSEMSELRISDILPQRLPLQSNSMTLVLTSTHVHL